jgi:hypothetical protein
LVYTETQQPTPLLSCPSKSGSAAPVAGEGEGEAMRVEIKSDGENGLLIFRSDGLPLYQDTNCKLLLIDASEFNRHHEGVWNSRVLAFVPQQPHDDLEEAMAVGLLARYSVTHFSDGTPVSSYEQFN